MSVLERLLLAEEVLQLNDPVGAEAVFSWLNRLKNQLPLTEKAEIKKIQRRLLDQLSTILIGSPGPPVRVQLADCLALLFHLGDPLHCSLFVEKCNDIIRNKDDSPSALPSRLAAVACLGSLFEQLGRMLSGSSKETFTNLLRALKNAESQGRCEILGSLEKMLRGLGPLAAPVHRDIYKSARTCLTDRSMCVRCAAAKCLLELQKEALFLSSSELEHMSTACFRAFEGSLSSVSVSVSELLGSLLATALQPKRGAVSLEEVMDLLLGGFIRGGVGFLRASGDKLKGTSSVSKEVRLGIAQTCVVLVWSLGSSWVEQNLSPFLTLVLELVSHSRSTLSPSDAVLSRGCVSLVLRAALGGVLGEKAQSSAEIMPFFFNSIIHDFVVESSLSDAADPRASSDMFSSQHALICVLLELGALLLGLGSSAAPLLSDPTTALVDSVVAVLLHPSAAVRLAGSWCLRCVAVAMPSQNAVLLDRCAERLTALKSNPEAVSGFGFAVCALVSAAQHHNLGLPHSKGKMVLSLAESLLRSASQNSRISLQRTQVGWMLLASLTTLGPSVVEVLLSRLLLLCRCVFPASLREQDMELRRGDYFTWQVTLEGRSGALCGMYNHIPGFSISYCFLFSSSSSESFGLVMNQLVSDLCNQDQPCSELTLMPSLCSPDDLCLISPSLNDPYHAFTHQILEQFVDSVNQLKGQKQQTVQTHVCAAFCSVLKVHSRSPLGPSELRPPALSLLWGALEGSSLLLRCAAAEGLARLVQSVNDSAFTVSAALLCFDRLKLSRDAASRCGVSLALGALYRYQGGISSAQHLSTCVGVLFTLSQDITCPEVQAWALHSLSLIMDFSGGLFRLHLEPCVSLVLRLLLSSPQTHPEVHLSLGRCLQALITCLGPDLQGTSASLRDSISLGSLVLQSSSVSLLVQSRSISCLQQLHMFCPAHVDLRYLVPSLCVSLSHWSLLLRRSVISCLRQIVQRDALEVSELAVSLAKEQPSKEASPLEYMLRELGLEGALFSLLDRETDPGLIQDLDQTLGFMMVSSLSSGRVGQWLRLCRDVLSDSSEEEEEREDWSSLGGRSETVSSFSALRWSTRRIAVESVCTVIQTCAKNGTTDLLVPRLGDLVRMAFMASTDHSAPLRLSGLQTLLEIIRSFSSIEEPEFPGHFLLEQYQANVGAALRPAFAPDAPPDVTAKACQVCSAWICSGVVSDLRDLRRVHQLLVSSLSKIQTGQESNSQLYSEAAATMETLAVLKAWAQVYIVAVQRSKVTSDWSTDSSFTTSAANDVTASESEGAGLLELVQSDLPTLSRLWLAALQDHATLSLPPEQHMTGGSFFSPEMMHQARVHFCSSWAPILHASALWLHSTGLKDTPVHLSRPATPTSLGHSGGGAKSLEDVSEERLHLILGVAVQFLCSPHSENQMENIMSCLEALQVLLDIPWNRISNDQSLSVELLSVLHRLMVTRESEEVQSSVVDLLKRIVCAAQEHVREKRHSAEVDDGAAEKETLPVFGEGRDTGGLVPGQSLVFSALQICLCVLVRKLPKLSPTLSGTKTGTTGDEVWSLSQSDCALVSSALFVLSELPSLCSPEGQTHTPLSLVISPLFSDWLLCLEALIFVLQEVCRSCPQASDTQGYWRMGGHLTHFLFVDDPELAVDQVTLLRALAQFLLSSSGSDICGVSPLCSLSLDKFTCAMDSKDPQVTGTRPGLSQRLNQDKNCPLSVLGSVLVSLVLPLLVSFLLDENALSSTPSASRSLHDSALKDLMRIGPQHPVVFRSVMSSYPELKSRLEAAIKVNQEQLRSKPSSEASPRGQSSAKTPSITLKTNFL
uniref:HEAT repeat containing 5A n=1 Tax=Periophthalmus magnuspinnatus TaxID=409849 RepID=A0A3B4AH64_9GOBI